MVEYGRRISTGEGCAGAHRAQESICAGEEELCEFDRKLGAVFEDDRADRSVGRARAAQIRRFVRQKSRWQRHVRPVLGYPYWADNCFFLFMAPAGIDPGSSPETTIRTPTGFLIYSS